MQKRMFRDRFGLTDLVLSGQKTQTRDVIKLQDERLDYLRGWNLDGGFAEFGRVGEEPLGLYPKYYVGEVVAVAQSYEKAKVVGDTTVDYPLIFDDDDVGYYNKMFVKAKLMPHAIKITKIRFERLQDISDEDCMKEGVKRASIGFYVEGIKVKNWEKEAHRETASGCLKLFPTPRQAFAALIDKINGKGTWDSNPYVWAYDFELVK